MTDRPMSELPSEPTPDLPGERPTPRPAASVRVRLTLLMVLVLLPATLLLAYVGYESGRNARRAAEDELRRLAELVAASQVQRLTEARDLLAVIAQFPEVQEGDVAACTTRLQDMLPLLPAYTGIGAMDGQGRLYCATTPITQPVYLNTRAYFTPTMETNTFAVGDYAESRRGGPVLAMGYPVRNAAGEAVGVASVGLNLHALNEAAATIPLPDDTDLLLFDYDGTVLAHAPEAERWLGQDHPELGLVQQALSTAPAITQQTGFDGVTRVYATLSLNTLGGHPLYLALGRPVGAVYAAADDLQRRNLAGIILLEALAIITIWQASVRLLLRPMQELGRATRRLTVGDLSARTGLDHREGEFGQLAYAFDHLAETLSRREAARAALAQENAQLYTAEQSARQAAEQAAQQADQQSVRLARLQTITAGFSEALSADQVLDVMMEQTLAALDADAGAVALVTPDGTALEVTRTLNFPATAVVTRVPLDSPAPVAEVVRTGEAVWVASSAEYEQRFPAFAEYRRTTPFQSVAYLPLEVEGRRLGSLAVNFEAAREFTPEERALLLAMARQGAQALQRTRRYEAERAARAAAEAAQQRLSLLAEISRAVATSLDYASIVQTVLRLPLPTLADFCALFWFGPGGTAEAVAVAHRDPAREPELLALGPHYQPLLGAQDKLFAEAARARVPLYTHLTAERREQLAVDPRIGAALEAWQVESVLHAPLISGGRTLGMLTLVFAGSGRRHSAAEVELVQEITRRAAVALENAQLYAEAQQLNSDLEARVTTRTAQLAAANRELENEVTERTRMEAELARSHAQLREVHAHMQAAREDERTRISREIHDELGGMLTGLKMDVARLNKALPGAATERLESLSGMIDEMVRTVRRIATDLRPSLLDDFGLAAAIEWQLQEFAKRSGLDCEFESPLSDLEWDPDSSTGVFRAFQETLTNIARHAQAERVRVTLGAVDEMVELCITDDGRGISTGELAGLKSLGLAGMRERIEALHGTVTITGAPGQGTTVVIRVPLRELRRRTATANGD